MKYLFIGLGSIAIKHILDLITISNTVNFDYDIYVLRREKGELPEILRKFQITQITSLDESIYDAVFITNPTNLHYTILGQLKGKTNYFFIEKPIFENCKYDYSKLGINEKNAYVACPLRHSNVFLQLKNIVENNSVYSARIICSSYLPDWRPNVDYRKVYSANKAFGGGVTLDLIHELDYMVGLFGLPTKIMNIHGKYSHLEIDSDDLSVYLAEYPDKVCEVHLDYFGRRYQRQCEVYTKDGTYIADFKSETIEKPDGSIINCHNEGKSNLYLEMKYFINFIMKKVDKNINSPEHAFNVLKITLGKNNE